jgi:hypothetical protein
MHEMGSSDGLGQLACAAQALVEGADDRIAAACTSAAM